MMKVKSKQKFTFPYSISIDNEISCGQFYQLPQKLQIFGMTVTACWYLQNAMSFSFCHVLLFHGSNTRIFFDVMYVFVLLIYRINPPRKYSEGVHCTVHFTVLCTIKFLRCHKMQKINIIFHTGEFLFHSNIFLPMVKTRLLTVTLLR